MLGATDEETGEKLSKKEVLDETVTFIFAGSNSFLFFSPIFVSQDMKLPLEHSLGYSIIFVNIQMYKRSFKKK
jgi:hypothetical protein